MAIYQIDIEKSLTPAGANTVYWTNVYHVNQSDMSGATTVGQSIVALEKAIHATNVSFTKMRVANASPIGGPGSIIPLTGAGARSVAAGFLPLFNVFRVDFNVGGGRPSRKYLRGPVITGDNTSGNVVAGTITLLNNNYIAPLIATNALCDPQGQMFVSGAVYPSIGMRQLRRGSKRKTTSVL